jgi:hypothetical protein
MGHVYQGVKFAAVNEEPLLGVEAVEALGLAVDPTTPTRAYTVRLGGVR